MKVVTSTFRHIMGLRGALLAWPGSGLSGTRTPHGKTVSSTTHQIMT